jgi:Flp pilus assembly protein TadB
VIGFPYKEIEKKTTTKKTKKTKKNKNNKKKEEQQEQQEQQEERRTTRRKKNNKNNKKKNNKNNKKKKTPGACLTCIAADLIIKFVAAVSSSINSKRAPTSNASMMFAAWEVEPDASGVEKFVVDLPYGRLSMNGEMSTLHSKRENETQNVKRQRQAFLF